MITRDGRERHPVFVEQCDGVERMKKGDFRVHSLDERLTFVPERKAWSDFMASQHKLKWQLDGVDALIVEWDPVQVAEDEWGDGYWEKVARARKRFWHLSLIMPVVPTINPADTMDFLRYVERKGASIGDVRDHQITHANGQERLLASIKGLNPDREVPGGENGTQRLAEALTETVDWGTVVAGLRLPEWRRYGFGEKRILRIKKELGVENEPTM